MNLIGFVSVLILVITLLTIVFGAIAYFMYKIRERRRKAANRKYSYEEALEHEKSEFIYFE